MGGRAFALMFAFLAITGCATSETTVREVHCAPETPLNEKRICVSAQKVGALLGVRVNPTTRDVQVVIKQNDGLWGIDQFFLTACAVIDQKNWQCEDRGYVNITTGMKDGVYYRSRIGRNVQYHSSSMRGMGRLLFELGALKLESALNFPF